MQISGSKLTMTGSCQLQQVGMGSESLKVWVGNAGQEAAGPGLTAVEPAKARLDKLEISVEAKQLSSRQNILSGEINQGDKIVLEISEKDKQKILLLQAVLEKLSGKKIEFTLPEKIELQGNNVVVHLSGQKVSINAGQLGWGLAYEVHEQYWEQEKLNFAVEGVITTENGRTINLSVHLNMSREYYTEQHFSFLAGAAKIDPLVINFDGTAPGLTDLKISFDLDADGKNELMSFVKAGSGFLALDLNQDNAINNGGELFGPATGNGFAELAAYDEDGNNWIDEQDAVFHKLRIWTKNEAGEDVLLALGELGIGAIYLGHLQTPFLLTGTTNMAHGQIRASGVFVRENGAAGLIQEIDLLV